MLWRNITVGESKPYFYRSRRIPGGYELELTDFISVWKEVLDNAEIRARARELGSVLLLETDQDIDEVLKLLEGNFKDPESAHIGDPIRLDYEVKIDDLTTQKWYFECLKLPTYESQQILGTLITGLLDELSKAESRLIKADAEATQLRYHIKNLNRICDKDAYQPHRFQEAYYSAISADILSRSQAGSGTISSGIPSSPPGLHSSLVSSGIERSSDLGDEGDTTIVGAPADPQEPSSGAFSQALTEFSRESTEEDRRRKLEQQLLAPKKKRRRF